MPSRPDGRRFSWLFGEAGGKSGLHRAGCWVTPSPGDGKESATEKRPPSTQVRKRILFLFSDRQIVFWRNGFADTECSVRVKR